MKIYKTKEWKGFGNSSSWNEYHQNNGVVTQYKCTSTKFFDGKENTKGVDMRKTASWKSNDSGMPSWLSKYVSK